VSPPHAPEGPTKWGIRAIRIRRIHGSGITIIGSGMTISEEAWGRRDVRATINSAVDYSRIGHIDV
jgi:hypothetical protein